MLGGILGALGGGLLKNTVGKLFDDGSPINDLEPLIDPPEPGFIEKTNQFLGSNVGKIGTEVAGGLLSDFRSRRNTKNQFEFLQDKGLSPVEIAGGGGGAGATPAQGNTLGNGPATQILSQQQFQREQNELDRRNQLAIAEVQADAPRQQARIAESLRLDKQGLLQMQTHKEAAQYDKIQKEMRKMDFEYQNFWAIKLATMSMENVMAALALFNEGANAERILTAVGDGSPEEVTAMKKVFNKLLAARSRGLIEGLGLGELTEHTMKEFTDEQTLGNKFEKSSGSFLQDITTPPRRFLRGDKNWHGLGNRKQ